MDKIINKDLNSFTVLVSVILPVYNAEKYLKSAILSILKQSYTNFELIIINDGSIDNSIEIINSFADDRIKLINNERNIGLVRSLNKAIKQTNGKYIARMDADDVSKKNRLEEQVKFLNKNRDVAVVGSSITVLQNHLKYIKRYPLEHDEIIATMLFESPFAHPSVMFNKAIVHESDLLYDEKNCFCEDYELWLKLSKKYKLANLRQSLLYYRVHTSNKSKGDFSFFDRNKDLYIELFRYYLNMDLSEKELSLHINLSGLYKNKFISDEILKYVNKKIIQIGDTSNNIKFIKKFSQYLFMYLFLNDIFLLIKNIKNIRCLPRFSFTMFLLLKKIYRSIR